MEEQVVNCLETQVEEVVEQVGSQAEQVVNSHDEGQRTMKDEVVNDAQAQVQGESNVTPQDTPNAQVEVQGESNAMPHATAKAQVQDDYGSSWGCFDWGYNGEVAASHGEAPTGTSKVFGCGQIEWGVGWTMCMDTEVDVDDSKDIGSN